ncbi:Aldehyde dehydrogenase [Psilocybe cubensis]|uniref:Aldehyde dehydrogenase n=2 Tax=Psilocybe cubensis TaxID=181762 RepID=A0ACB8H2P4_PSICU|nr:Aldehyde dehydrogenase [Psilocybe cubensis]KAH9481979.1 Aldehyde dehydrogenase [Psilocybe cubensis]
MSIELKECLFIAGKFVEGNGERIDVINPATKQKIASVHVAGQKEVDAAVDAAEKAWPAWADGDPSIRSRAMLKLADLVEENANILGQAQSLEMGKPIKDSIIEAYSLAYVYRWFAGAADKIHGKTSLNVPGFFGLEIRQPYGVTAGIIPWNAPLSMLALKTAPALATGNASIIKTSEKSPLSALLFAELVVKAGLPDGILSILSGARETGQLLASHMRIRKIAFTGSAIAGKAVAEAAARSNLKSCTLELGGKSPVIVFEDCDMEDTVTRVLGGFNTNSGQICIAGTRVYVQDIIFDKFAEKLAAAAESYKVGDPTDQSCSSGPQVDILQHKRVLQYIETGKAEGAKVLTGGTAGDDEGFYVKPTIFIDVKDDAIINKEEIFGPVAVLHKFTSEEEVLKRANDTEYGLAAYVFTKDVSRAIRFIKGLEAGQVGVNTTGNAHPDLAFGGWKGSGIGRELGDHAIHAYTEVKTIFIR